MEQVNLAAVLTGDLVGSTQKTPDQAERAISALSRTAARVGYWHGASPAFSWSRGDGWQVWLNRPHLALRTALIFRAAVRSLPDKIDTRIAVAIGMVTSPATPDLNAETGTPYITSGRALEQMEPHRTLRVVGAGGALAAAAVLADHTASGWTIAQASAMDIALDTNKPVDREIAKTLEISQQAANKRLASAGFHAINQALDLIENDPVEGWLV